MFYIHTKCNSPVVVENDKAISMCKCNTLPDISECWECDEDVYHLLKALWDKGYNTQFSCSGHSLSRYYTDDGNCVLHERVDINGYIVIPGNCVRVKDLEKYKFGIAYIEKSNTMDLYIQQMQGLMDIPKTYVISENDPTFKKFAYDYNSKKDADAIMEQIKHPETWYAIRAEYDSGYGLESYMKLMESRMDMAKLISLLPENVKED